MGFDDMSGLVGEAFAEGSFKLFQHTVVQFSSWSEAFSQQMSCELLTSVAEAILLKQSVLLVGRTASLQALFLRQLFNDLLPYLQLDFSYSFGSTSPRRQFVAA